MTPSEISEFLIRLRAYGKNIEGDGFGKVGDLKAALKRTCVRLEEVVALIEQIPSAPAEQFLGNPDCCGFGGDNVAGCECRKIFDRINRKI